LPVGRVDLLAPCDVAVGAGAALPVDRGDVLVSPLGTGTWSCGGHGRTAARGTNGCVNFVPGSTLRFWRGCRSNNHRTIGRFTNETHTVSPI
jgi:hypothetical protein